MRATSRDVERGCDNVVNGAHRPHQGENFESRDTVRRLVVTASVAVVCALSVPTAATAATTDFSSSFESSDPRPVWTNTSERSSGVIGPKRQGIPGNVTDSVIAMRARGENPPNEVKENLVD